MAAALATLAVWSLSGFLVDDRFGFAQLLAHRGLLALGWGLVAVPVAFAAVLARKRSRFILAGLACTLTVVAAGQYLVLADRGITQVGHTARPPGGPGLTVLAYNLYGGATRPEQVARLATDARADVLALSEAPEPVVRRTVEALQHNTGERYTVYLGGDGPVGTTALLISPRLGEYRQVPGPATQAGSVRAEPATAPPDVGHPVLVAVHPQAPVPGMEPLWRHEQALVLDVCSRTTDPLVMAGDFNATLDHGPLRELATGAGSGGCRDLGLSAGIAGTGTWATGRPAIAGTPIDHVLASAAHYTGADGQVVETGRSDHRAVLVRAVARN